MQAPNTFLIPDFRIADEHGGLPVSRAGLKRNEHEGVRPGVPPEEAKASISACGLPQATVVTLGYDFSTLTTKAPTMGLGCVRLTLFGQVSIRLKNFFLPLVQSHGSNR